MLEDVHRVRFNKPLHYPDVIGGHCLIPNAELLLNSYDSKFLRLILKLNEKRKKKSKIEVFGVKLKRLREELKPWR